MDPFIPHRVENISSPPTKCPILLLDGGLGTTLADQHAYTFDDSTPLWSSHLLISDPSTLLKVQTAFANAGADIILSATYQASYEGFARTGDGISEEDAGEFMRSGVSIAREAFKECGRNGRVALSLGAYGATMVPSQEYSGKYDEQRMSVEGLRRWHVKRLQAFLPWSGERRNSVGSDGPDGPKTLCWNEVNAIAFETLPLLQEIKSVRRAMDVVEEERRFWISCVFPGEENVLPDGSSVKEVVRAMLRRGEGMALPMGVGINCTKVGKVEALVVEFEREIELLVENGEAEWPALVVYPDGTNGEVYDTKTKEWVKDEVGSESEMSWDEMIFGIVARAKERGLWKSIIVGGCCKTTPEDIGKLRRRIDQSL